MAAKALPALAAVLALAATPAPAQQTPLSPRALSVPGSVNPAATGAVPRSQPEAAPRSNPAPRPRATTAPRPRGIAAPPAESVGAPRPGLAVVGLARDLEAALALDAAARGITGQRDAVRARDAQLRALTPGAPAIGTSFRSDTRGPREAREWDVELAAPIWLFGQRSALSGTIETGVAEQEQRYTLRRLELAGRLRDAYWAVAAALSEARVARDRVATARDVGRDFQRRVAFGDIAETEALLARNEELAAELELARAEAAIGASRAAYRTLTGGSAVALAPAGEATGSRPEAALAAGPDHPQLRAAEAALAAAEARARLVAATPSDNPEIGVFTRRQGGPLTEDGYSLGLRFRIPLATEARNAPRRAEAEADRSRAAAELQEARRVVEGAITLAQLDLSASETARRLAAARRAVADQQLAAAQSAFRNGEIGAFDLFRVRQLQIEAAAGDARARVEAGRARSRLNQAVGAVPLN